MIVNYPQNGSRGTQVTQHTCVFAHRSLCARSKIGPQIIQRLLNQVLCHSSPQFQGIPGASEYSAWLSSLSILNMSPNPNLNLFSTVHQPQCAVRGAPPAGLDLFCLLQSCRYVRAFKCGDLLCRQYRRHTASECLKYSEYNRLSGDICPWFSQ